MKNGKSKTFAAKLLLWGFVMLSLLITTTKPGAPIMSKRGPQPFCSISKDEFDGCTWVKEAMTRPSDRFRSYSQKKKRSRKRRSYLTARRVKKSDEQTIQPGILPTHGSERRSSLRTIAFHLPSRNCQDTRLQVDRSRSRNSNNGNRC